MVDKFKVERFYGERVSEYTETLPQLLLSLSCARNGSPTVAHLLPYYSNRFYRDFKPCLLLSKKKACISASFPLEESYSSDVSVGMSGISISGSSPENSVLSATSIGSGLFCFSSSSSHRDLYFFRSFFICMAMVCMFLAI